MGAADLPTDAKLFVTAAQLLFGQEWTGQMARALSLNERTVSRIRAAVAEGRGYPINPNVLLAIAVKLRERETALAYVAVQLDAAAKLAERR